MLYKSLKDTRQIHSNMFRIPCDPKHVGVYFNVCLLDFYITLVLTSTTVITECISWSMKVTDNNDAQRKPETLVLVRRHYVRPPFYLN